MNVAANILVLNEYKNIKGLIANLIDAEIDEIIILDGGSTDGTFEYLYKLQDNLPKLKLFRWPQIENSEYKKDFREKDRRNFMMSVSTADYILYIDADERIEPHFKCLISGNKDIYALQLVHFWNKKIRVNMKNDMVWSPGTQYRIVRRDCGVTYKSNDINGLHNFLSYHGLKIYNNNSFCKVRRLLAPIVNRLNGLRVGTVNSRIFHLHYYNVNNDNGKKNDLRRGDFTRSEKIVLNILEGEKYDYLEEDFLCVMSGTEDEMKILKYL